MRKVKIKGIWKFIFSDEEKNKVYKEQKQNLSAEELKIMKNLNKKSKKK